MSEDMKQEKIFETHCEEETKQVAALLAEQLAPGQIVCLNGEMGVGKTIFAKGLCAALGVAEYVSSPTFTLVNEYEGTHFPVYHFDLYRIEEPEELYAIGFEEFIAGHALVIIEWSERAGELLPAEYMEVLLERQCEDGRKITVKMLS